MLSGADFVSTKDDAGAVDLTATVTEMTISDGTHSYMIKRKPVPGPVYVALRPTSGADITYDVTIDGGKKEDATSRPVRWCILPRNMFCTRT